MLTEAQREARRSGLGGSDAAAVCGRHPTRSPLNVWLEKVYSVDTEANERMFWGNKLENAVCEVAAERLGLALTIPPDTFRHPTHPELLVNVDGLLGDETDRGLLEAKCVGFETERDLGMDGTDQICTAHLYQVQHAMLVGGWRWATVAYLVSGSKLRLFRVDADDEFAALLIDIETSWWARHVVGREAPVDVRTAAMDDYLARRYPKDDGSVLKIEDGHPLDLLATLRDTRTARKIAVANEEAAEREVKTFMGDAKKVVCPFGTVSWSATKRGRSFRPNFEESENGSE